MWHVLERIQEVESFTHAMTSWIPPGVWGGALLPCQNKEAVMWEQSSFLHLLRLFPYGAPSTWWLPTWRAPFRHFQMMVYLGHSCSFQAATASQMKAPFPHVFSKEQSSSTFMHVGKGAFVGLPFLVLFSWHRKIPLWSRTAPSPLSLIGPVEKKERKILHLD